MGPSHPSPARRGFLASIGAVAAGALSLLAPAWSSVRVLFDPLRRGRPNADMVFATKLAGLPDDGVPRKFQIAAARTDAWTTHPNAPVGAVYLRRSGRSIAALNVACPHAGCFVNVASDRSSFVCPCHKSSFDLDGTVNDPSSPSPRAMDALEVEIRNGDEVWVRFQKFRPGTVEKTPVA